ncbi:MAG TPA: type II toxin-antitoxin system RelE/ParE family toxin [Armatimonadota bacterium]|jgi:plasmid stabilization system protein ParE
MARRIEWTDVALGDVDEAAAFIARDSPRFAAALVSAVFFAVERLSLFPGSGRIVPEVELNDIREIVVQRYRLIYQVSPQRICILAFVHGARDLESIWPQREPPQPEE